MLPSSSVVDTAYGRLQLIFSSQGLKRIEFVGEDIPPSDGLDSRAKDVYAQLEQFFAGTRTAFEVDLDFSDMPEFQADVLKLVATIPYGRTRSYEQIARYLDNPKAARAVGQANGNNPLPIIIPCHRVIGKKGGLTGYAFGLEIKKKLLRLENPKAYRPQIELFTA